MTDKDVVYCGSIDWWMESNHSTWTQCRSTMTQVTDTGRIIHQCDVQENHGGNHRCDQDHRWGNE